MPSAKRKAHNQKYHKSEAAIGRTLIKIRKFPAAGVLARHAKISRATLHRHHKTVSSIPGDYEKSILTEYSKLIPASHCLDDFQIHALLLRTLSFIANNRQAFAVALKYNGSQVLEKMIFKLKPKLSSTYHLSQDSDEIFHVYVKEVAGTIELWGRKNFPDSELDAALRKILYLTRTMCTRLAPLKRQP